MLLSSLLSASVLGVAAQAFMVPAVAELPDTHNSNNVVPAIIDHNTQVINLDCSSCLYAVKSDSNKVHEWTPGVASDLEMKFEVDGKLLKFNGVPFYPKTDPAMPPLLSVSQKKKDGEVSTMEGYDGQLRMSYSVEYSTKQFKDHTLVTLLMTVMGIDGQMIKVDNVQIKVIKGRDGTLSLFSTTLIPASPNDPDAKCENILCRFFTKILTNVNKAKATAKATAKGAVHKMKCFCVKCIHALTGHKNHPHPHHKGGKHPGAPHRRPDGTMELPSHIQFKPGHKFHHHQHTSFFGRVALTLVTTVKVVFVPILIGVAFGMAASAVGMLVGQVIVFLWMRFRGNKREAAYQRLETEEKDEPPAYQDVAAQSVEVLSEKEVEGKA
ncbi:hypothetical protein JMJ35_004122 [Cladonia borealis]|uniref:DUF7728 domain-containing protein n=1 Tax=Cladonia borealis TaxID=184061 RepID=A0AA39R328_9LECA|nr:hypothetical protein JMJ35_004122 [Cladonia borealis]